MRQSLEGTRGKLLRVLSHGNHAGSVSLKELLMVVILQISFHARVFVYTIIWLIFQIDTFSKRITLNTIRTLIFSQ